VQNPRVRTPSAYPRFVSWHSMRPLTLQDSTGANAIPQATGRGAGRRRAQIGMLVSPPSRTGTKSISSWSPAIRTPKATGRMPI
jgi:hypothetical protein